MKNCAERNKCCLHFECKPVVNWSFKTESCLDSRVWLFQRERASLEHYVCNIGCFKTGVWSFSSILLTLFMLCRLSRLILCRDGFKQNTVNVRASWMIDYKVSMFPVCQFFMNWSSFLWIYLSYLGTSCSILLCTWLVDCAQAVPFYSVLKSILMWQWNDFAL